MNQARTQPNMRIPSTGTPYPSGTEDWEGHAGLRMFDAMAQRAKLSHATWCPPGDCLRVRESTAGEQHDRPRALVTQGSIAGAPEASCQGTVGGKVCLPESSTSASRKPATVSLELAAVRPRIAIRRRPALVKF